MKKTTFLVTCFLIFFNACRKETIPAEKNASFIKGATDYFRSAFPAAAGNVSWEAATVKKISNSDIVLAPVNDPAPRWFKTNLDPGRMYNAAHLQYLIIYRDSTFNFHAELLKLYPDSNAFRGLQYFTGIIKVSDWSGHLLKEYKYEGSGKVKLLMKNEATTARDQSVQVCYTATGYNYGVDHPDDGYYWEEDLGCENYFVYSDESWRTGYGSIITPVIIGAPGSSAPASSSIVTIASGNNIIGNISDYTKCFNNVAGSFYQYSVTICVSQPIPGTRETWGFNGSGSALTGNPVSVGHSFLILTQAGQSGTITRNIGFYPQGAVDPLDPRMQGQLNNDTQHYYNISLTVPVDNSQFFSMLAFISHGNDAGYYFDLNTNNCTSFVINTLKRANINLPATAGSWPNGGGYNPGDFGEDIRSMNLLPGMIRNTIQTSHPNHGDCY